MSHRHEHAQFYTPISPEARCNCGECFGCRQSVAQAKVDSAADWAERACAELDKARDELERANTAHAEALAKLAEVQP